ncbi:MCE family protein [bacterium]|nr:MCE family protein [bacterium]
MNEGRRREVAAGVFLFFGLLVLLFGISWLKDYWTLRKTYPVKVRFTDIGGLRLNDPVDVAGVIKGKVTKVDIRRNEIIVTLNIDDDIDIPVDSRVTMRSRSLFTGEKYIKIDLGQSDKVARTRKDALFEGFYLDDFSLEHVQRTLVRIEELLGQLELKGIQETVESGVKDLFKEAQRSIEPIADRSEEIGKSIDRLASASESLDSVLSRIERGEGSLGMFIADDTVYNNLKESSNELKFLLKDIREHPEKYINVKVF